MNIFELTESQQAQIAEKYYYKHKENHCGHLSHLASSALEHAEKVANWACKGHCGSFGVEGCTEPDFLYLNAGDTYSNTVLAVYNGYDYEFKDGCWGDLVEGC